MLNELATERLRLRKPRPDDAQALWDTYVRDPEVVRYLVWRPHASIDTTRAFRADCIGAWNAGDDRSWVIELRETGVVTGMFASRVGQRKVELGYVLGAAYHRRGYATEACRAVLAHYLAQPGIDRVWAYCDVDNTASAKVLERSGMRCEGILRRWAAHPNISHELRDCRSFSAVRGDLPG